MDDLILHPVTRKQLEHYIAHPSHALLVCGPSGVGKVAAAKAAIAAIVGLPVDQLEQYRYFRHVAADASKRAISIEAIRDLAPFMKLSMPGQANSWRAILIEDAHIMAAEAQNALLKLLEEPPEHSLLVLTALSAQSVLPTIRSRSQQCTILQPPADDLIGKYTSQGLPQAAVRQAYLMSGGLPGLLHALLSDQQHPLMSAVDTARNLLQASQFERICQVDGLSKDKQSASNVIFLLKQMAQAALEQTAASQTAKANVDARLRQWHRVLRAAYEAEKAYDVSAQSKLALTNMMLSL